MNINKITAIALTVIAAASAFAGCRRTSKTSVSEQSFSAVEPTTVVVGENKIRADLLQSVSANDTVFTLNSVVSPENMEAEGCKYVYFDITIKNNTNSAYSLSTLNNFYLIMPDGEEVYSDVRTQLFAMSRFKDDAYFNDPFEIPANGEFSGIVGGFLVDKNAESFTVGFFPTKDSPSDKDDVMLIDITSDKIKAPDASILKEEKN